MRYWAALLLATISTSFGEIEKDAVKNADDFLAALKIFDLPEGKQGVTDTAWFTKYLDVPVLFDQEKLFEGELPTDATGIRGYKRLIQAKVQSQAKTQLTERYLLISYKDQRASKWKVWAFRKIRGIDVDYEANAARANHRGLDQFNYSRYAYWLLLGGKILAAREALETAVATDKRSHAQNFDQQLFENEVTALRSICGQ